MLVTQIVIRAVYFYEKTDEATMIGLNTQLVLPQSGGEG